MHKLNTPKLKSTSKFKPNKIGFSTATLATSTNSQGKKDSMAPSWASLSAQVIVLKQDIRVLRMRGSRTKPATLSFQEGHSTTIGQQMKEEQ